MFEFLEKLFKAALNVVPFLLSLKRLGQTTIGLSCYFAAAFIFGLDAQTPGLQKMHGGAAASLLVGLLLVHRRFPGPAFDVTTAVLGVACVSGLAVTGVGALHWAAIAGVVGGETAIAFLGAPDWASARAGALLVASLMFLVLQVAALWLARLHREDGTPLPVIERSTAH